MREVTEQDLRHPDFREGVPSDYEFREDGTIARKDRWETGLRNIAAIMGIANRSGWEVAEEDFWKAYAEASPQDQVFLLTLLHTGARRTEVFRLRWDDVDFSGEKIRLGTRKTAHGGMEYAWVPMTTELHNALADHRMMSKSVFVFTDRDTGEQYKARQHYMKNLCERAKVKPFGFHAIRHLSATILAYEGLDIPTVQAILRHKNPNTTARYIKSLGLQPGKLDRVFAKRKASKVVPFEAPKKAIGT